MCTTEGDKGLLISGIEKSVKICMPQEGDIRNIRNKVNLHHNNNNNNDCIQRYNLRFSTISILIVLQHLCSSGKGPIVCKSWQHIKCLSRATSHVPLGTKGQLSHYQVWQTWNHIYFSIILLDETNNQWRIYICHMRETETYWQLGQRTRQTYVRRRRETENLLRRWVLGWCRNWGLGAKKAYSVSLWIIRSSCIMACNIQQLVSAWCILYHCCYM